MNDDDNNQSDNNPSHIAVKQIQQTVNQKDEIEKDQIADDAGDSDGEYSSLGSAGPEDNPDDDPDAGGVMNINDSLRAVGLEGDDDEHPHELGEDRLNTNALDDISTPRTDDEDELEEAA